MGKLRRLRIRVFSSIGAVKRSVLRRQSRASSTASNPTTLTRLASVDSAEPVRTRSRVQKRKLRGCFQAKELGEDQQSLQLHWNEARRICSEPLQAIENLGQEEESRRSSTTTTVTDCRILSCGAIPEKYARKSPSVENLCGSAHERTQLSDEEEYDDVFLQSWEERAGTDFKCKRNDLLPDGVSLSEFSSGYSTFFNDNLSSPTLNLPPSSGEGAELEEKEESVSGWDDWRISESEITLGVVISSTELETIYSGYWHGNVHVRTRRVREVEDIICFLDEVTTLSCIRHENIQLFMGACLSMQKGSLAIIMSEIKGDSLHTRLHNYGHAFTNPSKIKILRQIAEGMEYLHGRGIPHGLLSSQSISLHFRVCISFIPQYSRTDTRQLETRDIPYLPPECVRELSTSQCRSRAPLYEHRDHGKRHNGCGNERERCSQWATSERRACMIQLKGRPTLQADVFAFGTVVYELMMLEYPYKSLPLESQIWRVGKGDFQTLTLIPKGRMRSIIARCWKKEPQHRPTFKDILATIEQDVIFPCVLHLHPSNSLPCISSSPISPSSSTKDFS